MNRYNEYTATFSTLGNNERGLLSRSDVGIGSPNLHFSPSNPTSLSHLGLAMTMRRKLRCFESPIEAGGGNTITAEQGARRRVGSGPPRRLTLDISLELHTFHGIYPASTPLGQKWRCKPRAGKRYENVSRLGLLKTQAQVLHKCLFHCKYLRRHRHHIPRGLISYFFESTHSILTRIAPNSGIQLTGPFYLCINRPGLRRRIRFLPIIFTGLQKKAEDSLFPGETGTVDSASLLLLDAQRQAIGSNEDGRKGRLAGRVSLIAR